MKKLIIFFKSKIFLKHLAIALGSFTLLIMLIFFWLSYYTDHGEYVSVPDFTDVRIVDLDAFIEDKDVRYRIIDSVYDENEEKGVVIRQDPDPNTHVKHNRMIYLYVTANVPQQIGMPKLVDLSPRQAVAILESYGLKLKRTVKKPGPSAVLAQLYNGKPIAPDSMVPKGAEIELWIGKGDQGETVGVPCLKGLTMEDAVGELTSSDLALGAVICKECRTGEDSLRAIVYSQSPPCHGDNVVNSGSSVDIFLTLSSDDSVKIPKHTKKFK